MKSKKIIAVVGGSFLQAATFNNTAYSIYEYEKNL